MFRLARGLSLSSYRREWLAEDVAAGIVLSTLLVPRRAWWPYDTELGRVEGLAGYHDVHSYPEAKQLPGLETTASGMLGERAITRNGEA